MITRPLFIFVGTNPNSPVHLKTVNLSPVPIVMPGDIHITILGNTSRSLASSSLSLTIKRKTFLGEIRIPCVFHVGSW